MCIAFCRRDGTPRRANGHQQLASASGTTPPLGSTFMPGLRPFEPSNAILLSRSEGKAQARFRAGSHGAQHLIGPSVER